MPNQDYDKNPKQTEKAKDSNRINLASIPRLSDLPRAIIGDNEEYDDVIKRALDPQNLGLDPQKLMERPISEFMIKIRDLRIFDENSILEDSQSEDEESLPEIPQKISWPPVFIAPQRLKIKPVPEAPQQAQTKNIVATTSQADTRPMEVSPQQVDTQSAEESTEQMPLQMLAQVVQQDGMQPVVEIQQQENEQFVFDSSWFSIYLTYCKNKQTNMGKSVLLNLTASLNILNNNLQVSHPNPSNILDCLILANIALNTIRTYLPIYKDLFKWTSSKKAKNNNRYYPNIIGISLDISPVVQIIEQLRELRKNKQIDQTHPTAQYFKEFENDLSKYNDGTRARNLEFFVEFLRERLNENENLQHGNEQPVAEVQQQINGLPMFNIDWFKMYLEYRKKDLADKTHADLVTRIKMLNRHFGPNVKEVQLNPSDILDCLVLSNVRQRGLAAYFNAYKGLFKWTSSREAKNNNRYYPNILGLSSDASLVVQIISQLRELCNKHQIDKDHPTAQYFKEFQDDLKDNNGGTRANNIDYFVEFLQEKLNENENPQQGNVQPAEGAQQQIQNDILPFSFCVYYIDSHKDLSQQAKDDISSFVKYINSKCQGRATRENVVEWMGRNIAFRNYYKRNDPMDDNQIQKLINKIKAFFSWTAENHIYNNVANDISIKEIKNKVDELINDPSFTHNFAKVHVGKPKR